CEGRVRLLTGRKPRQRDDINEIAEAVDAGRRIVERNRATWRFADDDGRGFEISLCQHMQRSQGGADGAEIAATHQNHRYAQGTNPVDHRVTVVEWHHDPADAFDQQYLLRRHGVFAKADESAEIDAAALALG